MSATSNQFQDLLARLLTLEESNKAMSSEILALQKENIAFQRDFLRAERENAILKKKVDCLEERRVQHEDKIEKLERRLSSMSKESNDNSKELKGQIKHLHDIGRVFNRALVATDKNLDLRREVTDLSQHICDIESRLIQDAEISTYVELNRNGPLLLGHKLHLDTCIKIIQNSMSFDTVSCHLNPTVDGVYALNAVFRQEGNGKLRLFARINDSKEIYLGMTQSTIDISSTMRLWKLKKGQKLSIQVCLFEGDAHLRWCNLYVWLF